MSPFLTAFIQMEEKEYRVVLFVRQKVRKIWHSLLENLLKFILQLEKTFE